MTVLRALFCAAFLAGAAQAQDVGGLRARHAALQDKLANNPFGRTLHVESTVAGNAQKGEIYAVIEKPFAVISRALARPAHWCDILTLQVNVKGCEAAGEEMLSAFITRKPRDPVDAAHRLDLRFQRAAASADYLHVAMTSATGPMGTRDYEIRLEAAPLDGQRTFIHMSYAYTLGGMARFAMDAYLSGAGRDRFGFTVVERRADGSPVYVDGVRGVVERAAMRYYLGVETYIDSLSAPPGQRLEQRLRRWYAAAMRYPQLREPVGADEYVEMKRRESAG
jgi:hypothetical protein